MPVKLNYDYVKSFFNSKGVELVSTSYVNSSSKLEFKCTLCGNHHFITFDNARNNKNPNYVCNDCASNRKYRIEEIREIFRSKGAELVSDKYTDAKTPLKFKCSKCGNLHSILWTNFQKGKNPNLLCAECNTNSKPDFDFIKREFLSKGAILLSDKYTNNKSPLYFKCSKCGNKHSICWSDYLRGRNSNLLCHDCLGIVDLDYEYVSDFFKQKNSELITDYYVNMFQVLRFKCSKCGNEHTTTWQRIKSGQNKELLCSQCLKGNMSNPVGSWTSRRNLLDKNWLLFIKRFYNLDKLSFSLYSSHHIIPFSRDLSQQTSLTNGYPIEYIYHRNSFVDPNTGVKNPFHMEQKYLNPENWPDYVKLKFHDYVDFKFLDLSNSVVTEFILSRGESDKKELFLKKKQFYEEGKLYIPIFFEEMLSIEKEEIIYSMVRNRLWRKFPSIFKYTNTPHEYLYARKLKLEKSSYAETKVFFNESHIQGSISSATIFYVLRNNDEIVGAISFGLPRVKGQAQYELLRLAFKKNTFISGGSQRLFRAFIKDYNPETIISYCDIRFSSYNAEETVYPKLGFEYIGYSEPNYKYIDPNSFRLYSRQKFQKHKLENQLEFYDANLSETENMLKNGFIKQYDCGNHKFLWSNKS